jgi:DnaJ-like protein
MDNQPPNNQQRHNQQTPRDPHQILGLAPGATREQVNAAYRLALRRLHPDTRPPDPTNEADADRAAPAHTHLPADLTVADLQHARRDLLRSEQQHRAEQPRFEQGRAGRGDASARARDRVAPRIPGFRLDSSSGPGPRGYRPGVGEPDILCGPVRYHGPPAQSC